MSSSSKVAVIGAGLAGIAAALRLEERGAKVVVFEKARGYGGRCSSKRWEEHVIDHGAQYFIFKNLEFQEAAVRACGSKLRKLKAPILTFSGEEWRGGPRYYHLQGNSRLARDLAGKLEVRTGILVEEIKADGKGWRIGEDFFDRIVSTAPLPQTRKLAGLEMGLSEYLPCLSVVLLYRGDKIGKSRGIYAYSDPLGERLIWTACENHKDGRVKSGQTALVAHASAEFSKAYLEAEPEVWANKIRGLVEERWKITASAFRMLTTHRWRYARIGGTVGIPVLPEGWYFAGDALGESRVEGAWLAGRAVAEQVSL